MTAAMVARSVLEIFAVIAIFIGLINEEKLVRWEGRKIRALRKRIRAQKTHTQNGNVNLSTRRGCTEEPVQWMHRPNRVARTYKGCHIYTLENHAA